MMTCPKCHDQFRKQERYDKHVAKCPGKVCRNCGKVGHLACGISQPVTLPPNARIHILLEDEQIAEFDRPTLPSTRKTRRTA